jgi:hypothetical protein
MNPDTKLTQAPTLLATLIILSEQSYMESDRDILVRIIIKNIYFYQEFVFSWCHSPTRWERN